MAGEAAAIAVAMAQKRIVRHFEEAGASTAETAIAFDPAIAGSIGACSAG